MIKRKIYYWKLQTPDKLIFKFIRWEVGVGVINDLIHWSEGDLSMCFVLFMCDIEAASSILATDIFRAIIAYCISVIIFPNPMLELFIFMPSCLEKAIILRHFLSNVKTK